MANHWPRQWDRLAQVPYTYSGNQWIGYDDVESVALKVKYAVHEQIGGIMVWSIETDDFRGVCQQGKYPLLNTINKVLNGDIPSTTTDPTPATSTSETSSSTSSISKSTANNDNTITSPSTSAIPSTPSTTTGTGPSSVDCRTDGYHRDPNDCSSFIICDNQIAHSFKCPTPLLYDESIRTCNWPSVVSC